MRYDRMIRGVVAAVLCGAILVALLAARASGEEAVLVPHTTRIDGGKELFLCLSRQEGEKSASFVIRTLAGKAQRVTVPLPSAGLDRFKLALVAETAKEGEISGFSLITWKPAEKEEKPASWPRFSEVVGVSERIRGAEALVVRRMPPPADEDHDPEEAEERAPAWGLDLVACKLLAPKEPAEAIKRTQMTVEEGSSRFIEDRRCSLVAPRAPEAGIRYGVVLIPVWKEEGRTLEGFDAYLVTTPAPKPNSGE